MQPSQTGDFLRGAATTAAGVAGGALLFQGINSLFSGHGGLPAQACRAFARKTASAKRRS